MANVLRTAAACLLLILATGWCAYVIYEACL